MSTALRRASSRHNAQHSTGPVTLRGRAAVRANAFKHGFYARVPLDDAESHEDYRACLDDFLADLRPAGAVEIELTHRYVAELWKLSRMERVERAIILGHANTTPFEYPECAGDPAQQAFLAFRDWVEVSMCQYTAPGQAPVERLHLLQNRLRRAANSTLRQITTLQAERFQSSALAPADSAVDARSAVDPLRPSSTADASIDAREPSASLDPADPSLDALSPRDSASPSSADASIDAREPSASLDPPAAEPPFSPAGLDRAHRVAPEVRERARMRERLEQLAQPPSPAGSSSPSDKSQPGPETEVAPPPSGTSQPDPATEAAPPAPDSNQASQTQPAENVTPPTPSIQTSNPTIGFVPHNRKSRRLAAPHAPPQAA